MKQQLPSSHKEQQADYVIDNNGSMEHLRKQLENLFLTLTRRTTHES
jgi:dephospho-CoA kinase